MQTPSLQVAVPFPDIVEHMRESLEDSEVCNCPGCPRNAALHDTEFLRWSWELQGGVTWALLTSRSTWVAVLDYFGRLFECRHDATRSSGNCDSVLCWCSWEYDLRRRMGDETV